MATSDLGKYSVTSPRFNLADKHFRASTDREAEYGNRRASKIKDSSRSGGPATRKVLGEAGTGAEASYPRYEVPTGVEAGDQEIATGANVPQDIESQRVSTPEMTTERQGAITDRAIGPYYVPGSPLDNILGHISEAQSNTAFDPDKPVGGENVPYQPTKGISGWFQRFGGNRANEQNIAAQLAQGDEWKQDAAVAKERKGKIEDYRTQRNIDAEIDNAREDKRNTQAVTMFDKAQEAQRAVLRLQNDYAKARNVDEQADILKRMGVAHDNAMTLQDKALAATASNLGLQQSFQAKIANLHAQMEAFKEAHKITNLGEGFVARGSDVYGITKGTPGYGTTPATAATVSPPLLGPSGRGPQIPQMDVGAPAMEPVTSTRSNVPSLQLTDYTQLPPGDGVRMGGALPPPPAPAPVPAAITQPRSALPSPVAEAGMLGRFQQAMPSLNLERSPGPGVQSPYLSEGELGQRVMEQIAYPLRAAAADEAKGEFANPQAAFSVLSRPPMSRLKRPDSLEMQQARKAGDLLRQMYAE